MGLYNLVLFLLVTKTNTLMNVRFGKMVQGEILRVITDLSFEECWTNCEQRAGCGSISYIRKMNLCYLNSVKQSIEVTTVIDAISRWKTDQVVYILSY